MRAPRPRIHSRDAAWAIAGLVGEYGAETLPLFQAGERPGRWIETENDLEPMPPGEEVIHDYRALSISLKAHPMSFLREDMTRRRFVQADALRTLEPGRTVMVSGLVLVRQRPGTASGVIFATLEDESGVANVIVWPKVFEANRRIVLGARVLGVKGTLQREGIVIHVIAKEFVDLTGDMAAIAGGTDIGERVIARADEGKSGGPKGRNREQEQIQRRDAPAARRCPPVGSEFSLMPARQIRTLEDFRDTNRAIHAYCSHYYFCSHDAPLKLELLAVHVGWSFDFYAGREILAARLRCSICGWYYPTFALGHAGKRPEFSGTHGAGTVPLATDELIGLQRTREALVALEMPWVGKRKAGADLVVDLLLTAFGTSSVYDFVMTSRNP